MFVIIVMKMNKNPTFADILGEDQLYVSKRTTRRKNMILATILGPIKNFSVQYFKHDNLTNILNPNKDSSSINNAKRVLDFKIHITNQLNK